MLPCQVTFVSFCCRISSPLFTLIIRNLASLLQICNFLWGLPLKKTWIANKKPLHGNLYFSGYYVRKGCSRSHTKKPRNRVKVERTKKLSKWVPFQRACQRMPLSKHAMGNRVSTRGLMEGAEEAAHKRPCRSGGMKIYQDMTGKDYAEVSPSCTLAEVILGLTRI